MRLIWLEIPLTVAQKRVIAEEMNPLVRMAKLFVKPFGYDIVKSKTLVDFYLHEYDSYEQYRDAQIFHNKRKIDCVWADEQTLDRVINLVISNHPNKKIRGICHGTRNGFEQNYLNSKNAMINAIGTDISETAKDYDNSVQWDFHKEKEDWIGVFDFVYSNSLDQSWKPRLAVKTWLNQVKRYGIVIIEHTESHGPLRASEMDPFGVRPIAMPYVLTEWFGHQISVSHSKAKKKNMDRDAWLFVCKKLVDNVD